MTCEHPQSVAAYCVADDDSSCIRFESVAIPPEVVGRIQAAERCQHRHTRPATVSDPRPICVGCGADIFTLLDPRGVTR